MADLSISADKLARIPLWFADKAKDTLSAEHWVHRIDSLQRTQGWSDEQTGGHAYHAFRGKALMFIDFLRDEKMDTDKWSVIKPQFLKLFGTQVHDHSRITNLSMHQKVGEESYYYAFRVRAQVREFFASMEDNAPQADDPSFQVTPDMQTMFPENVQRAAIIAWAIIIAKEYFRRGKDHVNNALCKTIFLNGLLPNIRTSTKLQAANTMAEAVDAAISVEKATKGPSEGATEVHHISTDDKVEDKTPTEAEVAAMVSRFMKRRNNGSNANRSSFTPRYGGNDRRGSTECWYCHKKNHMQATCRLRISRGAALVSKPRTVQEIDTDRMLYQEAPEDSDIQTEDESEDQLLAAAIDAHSLNY